MYSWQAWLETNYKVLAKWARKWHYTEWRELMAFLAFYLQKNWSKFSQIPDGEQRIKFIQKWFKNMVNWSNSEFNRSIQVNNHDFEFYYSDEFEYDPDQYSRPESYYEPDYTIIAEDISIEIKQYIIDVKTTYTEPEVDKILKVRQIYLTLKPHEKVLYDLYITQMLSIRAVAKKLNLPPSAVYGMLNELKNKILLECGLS